MLILYTKITNEKFIYFFFSNEKGTKTMDVEKMNVSGMQLLNDFVQNNANKNAAVWFVYARCWYAAILYGVNRIL